MPPDPSRPITRIWGSRISPKIGGKFTENPHPHHFTQTTQSELPDRSAPVSMIIARRLPGRDRKPVPVPGFLILDQVLLRACVKGRGSRVFMRISLYAPQHTRDPGFSIAPLGSSRHHGLPPHPSPSAPGTHESSSLRMTMGSPRSSYLRCHRGLSLTMVLGSDFGK